jgi:endoglycosylceramidase
VQSGLATWAAVGQTWNAPVFVGEFGITHDSPTAADLMGAHFDALDSLGISGTEWEYSIATEAWNAESLGLVAGDGTEYPVAQAVIRPYARAVAGAGVVQTFDRATHTFNLTYTPTGGVTEVSLPARAYPAGYRLDLQGACVDTASAPGKLLLQSNAGASPVSLVVTPKS